MLKTQMDCIQDFEGEDFNYTEVDVLGASINRLLKRASQESIEVHANLAPDVEPDSLIRGQLWA